MDFYDLIQLQANARAAHHPKKLFEIWERACRLYERGLLDKPAWEEVKAIVWPGMHALCYLQKELDHIFNRATALSA